MKKRTAALVTSFVFALLFSTVQIYAALPTQSLGFQGQLFNGSAPLTGSVNATFTFYDSLSGGSSTGSPIAKTVTVNNGYFGTQFSASDLSGVNFDQQLFIEVNINGTTLSPRSTVTSSVSSLKTFGAFSYASAPAVGPAGSLYFNATDGLLYISNGSSWSSAASQWATGTGTISYMGGNVGIGSSTPSAKLTVAGDIRIDDTLSRGVKFVRSGVAIADITTASNHLSFQDRVGDGMEFYGQNGTASSPFMRILGNGNVGIGTTTPNARLHVSSISTGTTTLVAQAIASQTAAVFDVWSASSTSLFNVLPNGNVGIGTTTQASPLTVAGDAFTTFHLKRESSVFTSAGVSIKMENMGNTPTSTSYWVIQAASGAAGVGNGGGRFSIGHNYTTAGPQEQFVISPYGNVGINTQFNNSQSYFPMAKLTVMASSTSSTTDSQFRLLSNRAALVANDLVGGIDFASHDTQVVTGGVPTASIQAIANTTHTASALGTDLTFSVTNTNALTEAMRILGNGNVGIGTSTPGAKLDVRGSDFRVGTDPLLPAFFVSGSGVAMGTTSTTTGFVMVGESSSGLVHRMINHSDSGGASPALALQRSRGTAASPTAVTFNTRLGTVEMRGFNGSSFVASAALSSWAEETFSSTTQGTSLRFETTSLGSATRLERVRIAPDGSVGIGTTTPTATLHASGTIRFSSLGAGTLSTDSLGNVTVSSDERLKNIQGMFATGLEKIKGLNPILYTWKPETGYDTEHSYAGFSAQNVQSAIPEAVSTNTQGFLTLSDRPIIAALVNAVKELANRVDALAERINTKFIQADEVNAKKLCVDGLCLNREQIEVILLNAGQSPDTRAPSIPTTEPVEVEQGASAASTSTSSEMVQDTTVTESGSDQATPASEPNSEPSEDLSTL